MELLTVTMMRAFDKTRENACHAHLVAGLYCAEDTVSAPRPRQPA